MSDAGEKAKLGMLIDRMEISELIHRYPRAVDAKDWQLLSSIFTDKFEIWMGPEGAPEVFGWGAAANVPASSAALMSRFPVTQHFLTDYSISVEGDRGSCLCYMQARHHLPLKGGLAQPVWTIGGYYTFHVIRLAQDWKVRRYSLHITWSENPPPGFELEFPAR